MLKIIFFTLFAICEMVAFGSHLRAIEAVMNEDGHRLRSAGACMIIAHLATVVVVATSIAMI